MAPQNLPRRLYRRLRDVRSAREERAFSTGLRFDASAPGLLLSPHWDDAVLDCWGVLSASGALHVVNVCGGVPGPRAVTVWDATTGASDSSERARERIAEDARALQLARREQVNLSVLDGQYRSGPLPALADIDAELVPHAPKVSRVYVPAAIGGHVDHRLVRRYGISLSRAGIPVSLYADLPYCILHGWPGWVDGRTPDLHRNVDAFWSSHLEGVPELGPLRDGHVTRLDDAAAAAKLAAMRTYETQYPALDYGSRGLLADPEIHRYEVLWALRGASSASPPR